MQSKVKGDARNSGRRRAAKTVQEQITRKPSSAYAKPQVSKLGKVSVVTAKSGITIP